MAPATLQPGRANRRRQRKVRIVSPRSGSRAATVSIIVAGTSAILLLVVWRSWRSEDQVRPHQRALAEWETEWKCEAGHSFFAAGQVDPRSCWTCDEPAYPLAIYRCEIDGAYQVSVMLSENGSGRAVPSRWLLAGRRWVEAEEALRCPRCGRRLLYSKDPLEGFQRRQERGGG